MEQAAPDPPPMDLPPGVTFEQYRTWLVQEEVRRRILKSFHRFPPVTTALVVTIVAIHLGVGVDDWLAGRPGPGGRLLTPYDVVLGARTTEGLLAWGGREAAHVAGGEWWRLLSAAFLHADALHLGLNMLALFGLGRLCEAVFGPGRLLGLFVLSGLAGSVASQAGGVGLSVGASGAVFGLMGAGVVFGRRFRRDLPPPVAQVFWRGLVPWILLNGFIGLTVPRIDNLGHLGGLLGGAALALVLGAPVIPGREGARRTGMVLAFLAALLLGFTAAGMVVSRFG